MRNNKAKDYILTPILVRLVTGRSGSTLFMQLLGTSDEIVFNREYPFESFFLNYLANSTLQGQIPDVDETNFDTIIKMRFDGALPSISEQHRDTELTAKEMLLSSWQKFSHIAMKKNPDLNPKYYAEKNFTSRLSDFLRDVLPYRMVFLIRDPRDVFLSIAAFDKKRGYPGFSRREGEEDMAFAKRWIKPLRKRITKAREQLYESAGMLIKYEDLANDLLGQAKKLNDWLDVNLDPQTVENRAEEFTHHMTSETRSLSVERWKWEMSSNLRDFLTSELHDELVSFGYEV